MSRSRFDHDRAALGLHLASGGGVLEAARRLGVDVGRKVEGVFRIGVRFGLEPGD